MVCLYDATAGFTFKWSQRRNHPPDPPLTAISGSACGIVRQRVSSKAVGRMQQRVDEQREELRLSRDIQLDVDVPAVSINGVFSDSHLPWVERPRRVSLAISHSCSVSSEDPKLDSAALIRSLSCLAALGRGCVKTPAQFRDSRCYVKSAEVFPTDSTENR